MSQTDTAARTQDPKREEDDKTLRWIIWHLCLEKKKRKIAKFLIPPNQQDRNTPRSHDGTFRHFDRDSAAHTGGRASLVDKVPCN